MNEDEFTRFLTENGYFNIRNINNGTIALLKLVFTTALVIGLDMYGYERRYCYEDPILALRAVNAMQDIDDEPLTGYVAKRGKVA